MDQRTDNRVQCAGDGEHDGDEVERERECYIELDGAHHALGERDEVRQFLDLVIDERDIRGVHGDVAAHAAHGDANVGGLERGRVVYAVADHADLIARGLIGADVGELVLGQAVCVYLTDVELRGDGRGGILMVAREQHRLDLKRGETVDHVCTLLANRVGQGEEACEHAVHSGVGDGAALRELGVRRLGGLFGNGDVMFGEKLRVARKDDFFVNAGGDAAPGHHLEVFALFKRLARLLLAAVGDGLAERVLRIALRRGAEAVELVIGEGGSPSRTRKPCFVALPMAAMMAVGVASTSAQGQKTTRIVTARMISPENIHVSAAAVSAMTTIHVVQRSARPTILALPASADWTRRIMRWMELSSPTLTASAGTAVSFPPVMTRAVCGVRWTSFSMPARARATVSSSRRPPSCMMNATSPAAKSSPMQTDAISASETSTSALMSNAVARPMTASKMMGMPQRMIAAHEASNGKGTRSKMLTISAMPEITSSVISFFCAAQL